MDIKQKTITGNERTDFIILGARYLYQQGYDTGTQSVSAIVEDFYDSKLSVEENLSKLRTEF